MVIQHTGDYKELLQTLILDDPNLFYEATGLNLSYFTESQNRTLKENIIIIIDLVYYLNLSDYNEIVNGVLYRSSKLNWIRLVVLLLLLIAFG